MKSGDLRPAADATRTRWIDFARGIGIILVVYGHVLGGLVRANVFPDGPAAQWMDYTLYTFHMPLFFFLAGLNVQHSLRRGARSFLEGKAWTIAYPYVLWSLVQGGTTMLLSRDANIPILPSDLAAIWYRPIAQFWFLYALMICHVMAALVPSRKAMIAIAFIALAVFLLLPVQAGLPLTLHHFVFYVAGLYGAGATAAWRPSGWSVLALIVLAFAGAVALGGYLSDMDANGLASLPACMLGIGGTLALCKLLDDKRYRWLAVIGVTSMTIYVLHILAGSGMRIVMLKLHVPPQPWAYLFAGTAAGVILPLVAHAVLARLHLLTALGLAPLVKGKPAAVAATQAPTSARTPA
ncbi:acyltransferase [Bradyrhizobium sp. ARR65]|uniref:acyltransferase family protein n=1 Tax=Bradyrhizobium sp. ARR65 TaxID=1040989 RepID=UPI000463A5D2|nr:acyltransferase [Bradyrhizobium sp. ARR65]